ALADLIDNSLTAGAKHIALTVHAGGEQSHIAVVDDGGGMALVTLLKAMQMGGSGPQAQRVGNDLGRFGLAATVRPQTNTRSRAISAFFPLDPLIAAQPFRKWWRNCIGPATPTPRTSLCLL